MPEHVRGPSGTPPRGNSEQLARDTLARLEELGHALAEIAAQLDEVRRTMRVSPRRANNPRRRGDTPLRLVKAAVIGAVALAAVVAAVLSTPQRIHRERFTPICTVQCARPVAHQRSPGPGR